MIPEAILLRMHPLALACTLLVSAQSEAMVWAQAKTKGDFFAVTAVKPVMLLSDEQVPEDLQEAMEELERQMPKDELARIDAKKSATEMAAYHRTLGPLIRVRWQLWEDRKLAKEMKKAGIVRPEDMSAFILHEFWRWRHGNKVPGEGVRDWIASLPSESPPSPSPGKPVEQATTLAEAHDLLERHLSREALDKVDACNAENELIEIRIFLSGSGPDPGIILDGPFTRGLAHYYDEELAQAAQLQEPRPFTDQRPQIDTPIMAHLRELGFTDASEMTSVVLDTFWCRRHGKDFRIRERVEHYRSFREEYEFPPGRILDPVDQSEIKWGRSYRGNGRPNRYIHLGRSSNSGRLLAFELPVGVYVPDKKLLEELSRPEALYGRTTGRPRQSDIEFPELGVGGQLRYSEAGTISYFVQTQPPAKR